MLNWLPFLDGTDSEAGVDRLVEVLDTDLARAHLHTRLLVQAREWETRRRDRSLLLRGGELKQAETWLADQTGRRPAATPAQAQLILASRRANSARSPHHGRARSHGCLCTLRERACGSSDVGAAGVSLPDQRG